MLTNWLTINIVSTHVCQYRHIGTCDMLVKLKPNKNLIPLYIITSVSVLNITASAVGCFLSACMVADD